MEFKQNSVVLFGLAGSRVMQSDIGHRFLFLLVLLRES